MSDYSVSEEVLVMPTKHDHQFGRLCLLPHPEEEIVGE